MIVAIFAVVLGVDEYHRRCVQLGVLPLDEHRLRSRGLWRLTALVALAGISMLMILGSLQ